jgi:hypothetical protein
MRINPVKPLCVSQNAADTVDSSVVEWG